MEQDLEHRIQSALDSLFQRKIEELQANLIGELQKDCLAVLGPAVREARICTAEELSAAARRIRSEGSVTGVAVALVETVADYCGRAALLIHKEERLLGFRAERLEDSQRARFQDLDIPVSDAAAIAHCVGTRGPVVTSGTPNEVSAPLVELLNLTPDNRVQLFPISLRESVLAVLYTDDVGTRDQPQTAAVELLTSLAEAWIEAVGARGKVQQEDGEKNPPS